MVLEEDLAVVEGVGTIDRVGSTVTKTPPGGVTLTDVVVGFGPAAEED